MSATEPARTFQFPGRGVTLTGERWAPEEASKGDVVLLHPYVLHAVSQNVLGVPRFITNPPIALREPMRFDRPDPSPVEQAVLRGLGRDRYAFRPTAARESVVPQRVRREEAARVAEQERLAAAHRRTGR